MFNLKRIKLNLSSTSVTQKETGVTLFLSSSCFFFCSFSFSFIFSAIFFFSETFGSVTQGHQRLLPASADTLIKESSLELHQWNLNPGSSRTHFVRTNPTPFSGFDSLDTLQTNQRLLCCAQSHVCFKSYLVLPPSP